MDFVVCALSTNGADALAAIDLHRPELLIVDLSLPDMSGFQVMESAIVKHPKMRCITISMHHQMQYAKRAMRSGARGYLVKADDDSVIKACIDSVLNGECFISQQVKSGSLASLSEPPDVLLDHASLELLTESEMKILHLMQQGNTSKEIAGILQISYRTVQNHRAHMCDKLGLSGANALLRVAIEKYGRH